MTTWYKTGYGVEIVPVEVEKATDRCVWLNGRRRSRHTTYGGYFPTFAEAYSAVETYWQRRADSARSQLDGAERNLKAMRQKHAEQLAAQEAKETGALAPSGAEATTRSTDG